MASIRTSRPAASTAAKAALTTSVRAGRLVFNTSPRAPRDYSARGTLRKAERRLNEEDAGRTTSAGSLRLVARPGRRRRCPGRRSLPPLGVALLGGLPP